MAAHGAGQEMTSARLLVFAAVMAALQTTAAHAQISQSWQVCEGYDLNPTFEQQIKSCI
jgi:hypothetical protein